MKRTIRGVSETALLIGLLGGMQGALAQSAPEHVSGPQTVAAAQPTPQQPTAAAGVDQTTPSGQMAGSERVVVTGSLIATTPEDAAKPVEVFTDQDLKEQGSPTVTEFLRALPGAAPSTENMGGGLSGNTVALGGRNTLNLRGQGADGTLVLLNGRRLSGRGGTDVNTIPMDVIGSVEVLKEGASATYGAGAVGGVINFRTRRDIDAPEINLSKTFYDDSDGAYKVSLLTGWVGDSGNVLIAATHEEEDGMLASKRDYATLPYSVNPGAWSLSNTTARFHRYSNWTTAQPSNVFLGSGGGAVSGSFNDFTSNDDCAAIGGALTQDLQPGGGASVPTLCAQPVDSVSEIVQGFARDQVYFETNADISDTLAVHFNALYSKYDSTGKRPPGASPIAARAMDPAIASVCGTTSCRYIVPYEQAAYGVDGQPTGTFVRNPFIDDFNARQPGTTNDVGPGMALLTSSIYRPYLFGGHPYFGYGPLETTIQREQFLAGIGADGEFAGDGFLGRLLDGVRYDYAAQYTEYVATYVENGDWLANRLQDAIMGYGGPDCRAVDRLPTDYSSAAAFNRTIGIQSDTAPGTNGCKWFNPFQSNFERSAYNGADNPNFPSSGSPNWGPDATQAGSTGAAGYLNDPALIEWMWASRSSSLTDSLLTFDALFSGEVPDTAFSLPGGEIGWAVGSQWRLYERDGAIYAPDQEEERLMLQECVYSHMGQGPQPPLPPNEPPTSRGCPGEMGTGNFYSLSRPLYPGELVTNSTELDTQALAYFAEVNLPILDTLNVVASVRHESFNGGKLDGTIWGLAGKWDVTDNVYLRGSYGTNFRATDALDLSPGSSQLILAFDNTRFGPGFSYPTLTRVDSGIRPESAETYNFGVGYEGYLFDGRLEASVDYFGIEITDEVATTIGTTVLDNVFVAGAPGDGSINHQADCSASLIQFISFNNGPCTQGITTAANISVVELLTLNGPSLKTEGIDYSLAYGHGLFGGDLILAANATQYLTFEAGAFEVNGVVFDPGGDRLGYRNSTRTGSPSQKLRANASVRWTNDRHSIGLRANYFEGMEKDPGTRRNPIVNMPGTANDVFSEYGWAKEDYVDFDLNYIYSAPFWEELELRLSILNLTDKDPPAYQTFMGYDQHYGNPRGRMFRAEVSKKF